MDEKPIVFFGSNNIVRGLPFPFWEPYISLNYRDSDKMTSYLFIGDNGHASFRHAGEGESCFTSLDDMLLKIKDNDPRALSDMRDYIAREIDFRQGRYGGSPLLLLPHALDDLTVALSNAYDMKKAKRKQLSRLNPLNMFFTLVRLSY